jgi:hypothetical protein
MAFFPMLIAFASSTLSAHAVASSGGAAACSMTGGSPWVPQGGGRGGIASGQRLFSATPTGAETFNMSICWRHGPCGGGEHGTVSGNKVTMQVMNNGAVASTCEGTFSEDCNNITWSPTPAKGKTPANPGCLTSTSWCRAWTPGCTSPEPPYGSGFAFLSSIGSNMVLQQAPAKSAVYGIVVGKPTSVKVTITDLDKKTSYEVDATFNSTKQPFGPEYVGGESDYASAGAYINGPHLTWKAFLKPTPANTNVSISAVCTGCTEDGSYSAINITNVTFGDVWHCSGQSNMWLPVSSAFAHNDTIKNITKDGKYHNIRLMAGNSGDCPGMGPTTSTAGQQLPAACPWMTASQAAITPAQTGGRGPPAIPPLYNFGATCWYFAQKLSDQLEAAGKLVPIGVTDTAIGGQRIEEYMVNDTTLTACSDRTGEASPEWNGRLYGKQTLPFVDMTVKGFLW